MSDAPAFCLTKYMEQGYSQEPRFYFPPLLAFTSTQPCIVTGEYGVDVHHVIYRSRGRLASDVFVVPLKHDLHMELHAIGEEAFEAKYNVNLEAEVVKNLQRFMVSELGEFDESKPKAKVRSRKSQPKADRGVMRKPEKKVKPKEKSKYRPIAK